MSIRQKVLFKVASLDLAKVAAAEKVSSYFGQNTFGY